MFEFVFPVTKGWQIPSPSHSTLAHRKYRKKPQKTPHQLGNQQHLKNLSDTCGCKHTDNDLSSCVFLHSLSPPVFPLGCFYVLTPAPISTLGFHYAPGVRATHPFPSCSCHLFGSAYGWFAKAWDLAGVHFSAGSSSSSLLIQITLNFITLLCIAWLPDPVVYG